MQRLSNLTAVFVSLVLVASAAAQSVVIKPFGGYLAPRLSEVNNQIESQIAGWQDFLNAPIPLPQKLDGRALIGVKVQRPLNEEYALAFDFFRYQEKTATAQSQTAGLAPYQFNYERDVEASEALLKLSYYFSYDPERRLNPYLEFGTGLIFAKAGSTTELFNLDNGGGGNKTPAVDTRGEFSKTAFMATFAAGFDLQLLNPISLWGEAGYQYAKLGQLEGKVTRLNEQPNADFVTNTSFDFSGLYVRAGLGIGLSF